MTPWSLALALAATARILVLPFDHAPEASTPLAPAQVDWRGSAFEEAIWAHLGAAGFDLVGVGERNRLLEEMGFLPGEPLTRATAVVLARELGAERVVVGSYRDGETATEVTARIIDIARGATLGVVEDYAPPSELRALLSQLAKNLFRIERDQAPPVFEACARRRAAIPLPAIEKSARARLSVEPETRRRLLEEALSIEPDYLESRLLLGRLLLAEGLAREAIEVLSRAEGEDDLYRAAYFDLGVAYLEVGDSPSALEIFGNLSHQTRTAAAYNNLGVALVRAGRLPEAVDAFEMARALGGGRPTYAFNLGWGYWRAGKGAQALDAFAEAAEADPVDAEARFLLGAASASQAKPAQAERRRAQALLLAPHLETVDPATVEGWARAVGRRGAPEAVSEPPALEQSIDLLALVDLLDARRLREQGRLDEAARALQRHLYRKPGATDVRRELAELHLERGELELAATELSVVLWTAPSADGHVALARVYLEMDEPGKAHEQVERALELDGAHLGAQALRGEIAVPAEQEPSLR